MPKKKYEDFEYTITRMNLHLLETVNIINIKHYNHSIKFLTIQPGTQEVTENKKTLS